MELTKVAECIRKEDYGIECSGERIKVERIVFVCSAEDLTKGGLALPFKKRYVDMCLAHYTMESLWRKGEEEIAEGRDSEATSQACLGI